MKRAALLLVLSVAFVQQASAAGWVQVLKNSPAEVFDDEDLRIFLDTGAKAVASDTKGETFDWSNPTTGSGGSFQAMGAAPSVQGLPCKRVRLTVYAKQRAAKSSQLTVCHTTEGRWKIAGVR